MCLAEPCGPHPNSPAPTPSVADGKQEIPHMLSQGGFVWVPHCPGLMRSPKPLPDSQSLPETADHCFLYGRYPPAWPHHRLGLQVTLSLTSCVVLTTPREDNISLSGPKDSTLRLTYTEISQMALQNSAWNSHPPWVYPTNPICLQ